MAEKAKKAVGKPGKYFLRASLKHPARKYQLGRHALEAQTKEFELNQSEADELLTPGPAKWIEVCDEKQFKADAKVFAKAKPGQPKLFAGVKEEM